jgi:uncharacterized protein (DUF1778 family)
MLEASTEAARRALLDQVFFRVDERRMKALRGVLNEPVQNKQAVRRLLTSKSPWER